jgi:hypothetical protein
MSKGDLSFKINKSRWVRFLNLVELSGDIQVKEVILDFTPTEVKVLAVTQNKTIAMRGTLKGEFKLTGQVGIDDLQLFRASISSMPDDAITFIVKNNKIVLGSDTEKVKISTVMRAIEYVQTALPEDKFATHAKKGQGNSFTLEHKQVSKILGYLNTLVSPSMGLEGEGTTITLSIENNQNEIVADFDIKETVTKFKVKLAKFFAILLKTIGKGVEISITKNDAPVYLKINEDDIVIEYIMAPISQ